MFVGVEVVMKTAKLFKNGDSQAVRLPKEFRFAGTEVLIKHAGDAVVLLPKSKSWSSMLASFTEFSADFMDQRDQPEAQKRETLS
jgi:antitoxin VapB